MKRNFHPQASDELADAIQYYEEHDPGLGREFRRYIEAAVKKIAEAPDRWRVVECGVRRYVLPNRFPYVVFYLATGEQFTVIAVAHASREPGYWRQRLG